jgi:GH15 family glucan-1,4-alpha-glucosidase
MAWVAFDRAVRTVEQHGLEGPLERWRAIRDEIHAEVCAHGFDRELGSFVQSYGSKELDASALMIPLVGFLPPTDPRVRSTVETIRRELDHGGFVLRYRPREDLDGLPPGEGVFLACSFWLDLYERLRALRNDLGLLAEEYDPDTGVLLGNFPQAFSHLGLVDTALTLSEGAPHHRRDD